MKQDTMRWLNDLNARFYSTVHQSFSETRTNSWPGWERLLSLPLLNCEVSDHGRSARVLDIGCGNLRFEKFLNAKSASALQLFAVDNCPQLNPGNLNVEFANLDVVDVLTGNEGGLVRAVEGAFGEEERFDLVVSFGFMHHVPSIDLRMSYLRSMADLLVDGGYVVVSLWRFLESEKLHAKALVSHESARNTFEHQLGESFVDGLYEDLEPNDWFLGWADTAEVFRYCHHFDDQEVVRLLEGLSGCLELVDDYLADGKTGALNRYLVFKN